VLHFIKFEQLDRLPDIIGRAPLADVRLQSKPGLNET
jgi:hypothetical protein